MHKDVQAIIADEKEIDRMLTETANQINSDYMDEELVFIPVLTGAVIFASDLVRRLTIPLEIECVKASSYRLGTVSGEFSVELDVKTDVAGKNVLLVEDIIDTGNTLLALKNMFISRGAKSVRVCALLDKSARRTADILPDYVGMQIPDEFVVGYGLDYAEHYRNLPYIGILKREVYEK